MIVSWEVSEASSACTFVFDEINKRFFFMKFVKQPLDFHATIILFLVSKMNKHCYKADDPLTD